MNAYKIDWNKYGADTYPYALYSRRSWWRRWEHVSSCRTKDDARAPPEVDRPPGLSAGDGVTAPEKCPGCGVSLSEEDFIPCDCDACPLLEIFDRAMARAIQTHERRSTDAESAGEKNGL